MLGSELSIRGGRGRRTGRSGGFSLIELVIVVVIIAIIGAIAIPKMSRGAVGANDSAVIQDLSTMRAALELYAQEHGGTYPTAATVVTQLTQYTDPNGVVNATRTGAFVYGPYMKALPNLPTGLNKGSATVLISTSSPPSTATYGSTSDGWIYDGTNFYFNGGASDKDEGGKLYNTY